MERGPSQWRRAWGRPVLLLNGDSRVYTADHPLPGAPNLARITINCSTTCPHEYPRLRVDADRPGVFSWARVPLPSSTPLCSAERLCCQVSARS